jgi:hypothetical protein
MLEVPASGIHRPSCSKTYSRTMPLAQCHGREDIRGKYAAGPMLRTQKDTPKVGGWLNGNRGAKIYGESMWLGQCQGHRRCGVRTWREAEAAALGTVPRCCSRHSAGEFRFQIKTELNGKLDRFKGWRSPAVFGVPPIARRAPRRCVGVCGSASRLGDGGGLTFCDFFARRWQNRA